MDQGIFQRLLTPSINQFSRANRNPHRRLPGSWDDREDRAYQRWTTENHRDNRDCCRLKRREQSEYWNWRHAHPDDDRDRH